MTELEVVKIVWRREQLDEYTNLGNRRWDDVDSITLQSCYDKGFLKWNGDKLVVTALGRRSCGGGLR